MSPVAVLVVEDYADLRTAIAQTLVRGDYTCDTATTTADAIGKLRERRYGAILLSPQLPIQDDPIIRFLAASQPEQLPKLILMRDPWLEDEDEGNCRSLVKPFNTNELFSKLAE